MADWTPTPQRDETPADQERVQEALQAYGTAVREDATTAAAEAEPPAGRQKRKWFRKPIDLHSALRTTTASVVIVLAAISFAVSAVALSILAMDHGLPWWLAWTLPVVLDGMAIAGGLMVTSRTMDGDKAGYGRFLVFIGAAASVAGNVLHADATMHATVPAVTDDAVLIAQVIAAAFPLGMLAAFEAFLLELKRQPASKPLPDAPTLDATVAEHVAAALPRLGEDLHGRLQTELDAQRDHLRDHLAGQLQAARVDPDAIARRVDATTRDHLSKDLRGMVASQVDALRDHLDQQAASTTKQVDARVDATVRDQIREALPGVTESLRGHLDAALETLRAQTTPTTVQRTVRQLDQHRELHGRTDEDLDAALEAAYATPPPDGVAWSKRTLAKAAGCGATKARDWLEAKKLQERSEVDARPGATTDRVQEAVS